MVKERTNISLQAGELIRTGEVQEVKRILETVDGDLMVFEDAEHLRAETESLANWNRIKQLADEEFEQISPTALGQLVEKVRPFIEALPAGHSKGHFLRDAIHLSLILKDPAYEETDRAELLAGIFGGIFHDIGNSVVERYGDSVRFVGHAEVGGYIFQELATGTIPPNILKLSKLAINAHSDYQTAYQVTRDGKTVENKPYEDEVVNESRVALWIARQTDRMDGQDMTWLVRKILVTTKPTEDFSWDTGFVRIWPSEEADFLHQYSIERRTKESRLSIPKGDLERRPNILETTKEHERSAFDKTSPYNVYDSVYFSRLLLPKTMRQMRFIGAVEGEPPAYDDQERGRIVNKFIEACKILEPSPDVEIVTQKLRRKFVGLPVDYQNHWAHGFELLTEELYPQWFEETIGLLEIKQRPMELNIQLVRDALHSISVEAIDMFDPRRIES